MGIWGTDWASFTSEAWATGRADCLDVFELINRAALEYSLPVPDEPELEMLRADGRTPPILLFREICRPSQVNPDGLHAAIERATTSLHRACQALARAETSGRRALPSPDRDPGQRIPMMVEQMRDGFDRARTTMETVVAFCGSDLGDEVFVGRVFDVVEEPFYRVCALFPRYLEILERVDYALRCLASPAGSALV